MKQTPLKRKTPLKRSSKPMKRTRLRKESKDDVPQCKKRIQALLRAIAIKRDGGCVLRHYGEAGQCGGYRQDGELVLQADHLITRSNTASFADMRNIVCLCKRHHGFWKKQHPLEFMDIIRRHVGEERYQWLREVIADKKPHRTSLYDWQKLEMSLTQDLKEYD